MIIRLAQSFWDTNHDGASQKTTERYLDVYSRDLLFHRSAHDPIFRGAARGLAGAPRMPRGCLFRPSIRSLIEAARLSCCGVTSVMFMVDSTTPQAI
jgi:hypothetical protein